MEWSTAKHKLKKKYEIFSVIIFYYITMILLLIWCTHTVVVWDWYLLAAWCSWVETLKCFPQVRRRLIVCVFRFLTGWQSFLDLFCTFARVDDFVLVLLCHSYRFLISKYIHSDSDYWNVSVLLEIYLRDIWLTVLPILIA